jgi:hypothetical protein
VVSEHQPQLKAELAGGLIPPNATLILEAELLEAR